VNPATTPDPPYYAVIFTSRQTGDESNAYSETASRMKELAGRQAGFLGIESAHGDDGLGITVSYWESPEAIHAWKANEKHLAAQQKGRAVWYDRFELRIAKVERAYGMTRDSA